MGALSGVSEESTAVQQGDLGAVSRLSVSDERQHAVSRRLRDSVPLPVLRPRSGKADGREAGAGAADAAGRRVGEDCARRGSGGGAVLPRNARRHRENAAGRVQSKVRSAGFRAVYGRQLGGRADVCVAMGRAMRRSDVQNFFLASQEETEPKVITCTVGAKPSKAQYYTTCVQENYRLLAALGEESQRRKEI